MSLLYKKQVTTDVSPSKPDYSVEQTVLKGMQNVETIQAKQKEFELKQEQKQRDYKNNLIKAQAISVYQDTATRFPDDWEMFSTELKKNLEEVYSQVDDENDLIMIKAEVQNSGSNNVAKVQKASADKLVRNHKNAYVRNSLLQLDSAEAGFPSLFNSTDNNLSPIQQQASKDQFITAMMPVKKVYEERNAVDENGNNIYTKDQIKHIESVYNNAGRYAVIEYASQNIDNNRKGVVETYNYLKENRNDIINSYNMDREQYDKTIKQMEEIIDGDSSAQVMKTKEMFEIQIDGLGIKRVDGEVVLAEGMTKEDVFNSIGKLDASYRERLVDKGFYVKNSKKLRSAYFSMEDKDMFNSGTVGGEIIEAVRFDVGTGDSIEEQSLRYDQTQYYYNYLEKSGIDVHSTNGIDRIEARAKVLEARGKWLLSMVKGATEDNIKTKTGQDELVYNENRKKAIEYAEKIMGLSDRFDEYIEKNQLDLELKYAPEFIPTVQRDEYQEYVPNQNVGMF